MLSHGPYTDLCRETYHVTSTIMCHNYTDHLTSVTCAIMCKTYTDSVTEIHGHGSWSWAIISDFVHSIHGQGCKDTRGISQSPSKNESAPSFSESCGGQIPLKLQWCRRFCCMLLEKGLECSRILQLRWWFPPFSWYPGCNPALTCDLRFVWMMECIFHARSFNLKLENYY